MFCSKVNKRQLAFLSPYLPFIFWVIYLLVASNSEYILQQPKMTTTQSHNLCADYQYVAFNHSPESLPYSCQFWQAPVFLNLANNEEPSNRHFQKNWELHRTRELKAEIAATTWATESTNDEEKKSSCEEGAKLNLVIFTDESHDKYPNWQCQYRKELHYKSETNRALLPIVCVQKPRHS